ncbi:transcription factor HBP-1b(c38)-like isoform X2 [Actinidia eriantha]|uniref:transcription factor HBP-1b(c38)-like isoform X2 n=1 Tax=Actinidia eriantha TaxID=165200 RepID=UPI002585489A|nr:transcription factor HBP-1b(c38)-like isoform X2 [Actinidia eriantha]
MDNLTIFGNVQFLRQRNKVVVIRDEREYNAIPLSEVEVKAKTKTMTSSKGKEIATSSAKSSHGVQHGELVVDSMDQSKGRMGDQKAFRRLAQNREAARKSRLRKKAYVQQLEHSRMKLTQLEQELQQARQQGIFIATGLSGDQSNSTGALAFDIDYACWLEEHQRMINDLRSVNSHVGDNELWVLVDGVMSHYDEIFRLKGIGAKSDVFHLLSGMWKTPAESNPPNKPRMPCLKGWKLYNNPLKRHYPPTFWAIQVLEMSPTTWDKWQSRWASSPHSRTSSSG